MSKRQVGTWQARWWSVAAFGLALLSLREKAASAAPNPASEVRPSSESGYYFDGRGRRVEFEPMYQGWFGSRRYPLYPVRAILENVGLLGIEVLVYWSDPGSSVVDWQFPDLGNKLTSKEAFRFDDNLLTTNYVYHPFAGTTHYVITRSNGFGVIGGFVAAASSSAIYELLLEWRELVSLNDLVVTPFGGAAMGEFFYQLGNYINSEPPPSNSHAGVGEGLHQGVKTTLGLPRDLHDALDQPRPPPSAPRDNLGLSSAYFHRFRVLAAEETMDVGRGVVGPMVGWDASLELGAMPGFLRIGKFERSFSNGNFTAFNARVLFAGDSHDSELAVDSHLFGYYQQDFEAASGGKRGHAHELSLGVGLDYLTQSARGQGDAYGVIHLLRSSGRSWLALGPAQLNLAADVAPDFASIHSIAYEAFAARYGEEGSKSSLQRHGYAHSWGFSLGASAALKVAGLELGVRGRYGHYESLEGAERFEEEVTREPHGKETMLRTAAYLRAEPEDSLFTGKLELAHDVRYSSLAEFDETRSTTRFLTALGLRF